MYAGFYAFCQEVKMREQHWRFVCDNCKKSVEKKDLRQNRWFSLEIRQTHHTLIEKQLCSKKCCIELMNKTKKIHEPKIWLRDIYNFT